MGNKDFMQEGYNFQHIYSWNYLLDLLDHDLVEEIDQIRIENPDAEDVDDLTVHPSNPQEQTTHFYQIKWHYKLSDQETWATFTSPKGEKSLLWKFWNSWNALRKNNIGPIKLHWISTLRPNKELEHLMNKQKNFLTNPEKPYPQLREDWYNYLKIKPDDPNFAEFYNALELISKYTKREDLYQEINNKMRMLNLRSDLIEKDFEAIIGKINLRIGDRARSKKDNLIFKKQDMENIVTELNFRLPPNHPTLYFSGWKKQDNIPDSSYKLDWTKHFKRNPRPTHIPSPATCNVKLLNDLRKTYENIRSQVKNKHIQIEGQWPLSAAFSLGMIFSASDNWRLEVDTNTEDEFRNKNFWSSTAHPRQFTLPEPVVDLEKEDCSHTSTDLFLTISIVNDITRAAKEYVKNEKMQFRGWMQISVEKPGRESIPGMEEAVYFARWVAIQLQKIHQEAQITKTHLFFMGPQALAVIIGQQLNALGEFQFYEFINGTYTPTFLV